MKRNLILSVACALFFLPMKAQQCEVNFDLNYDTTQKIEGISVKQGCAIPMDKKPLPQREGYRFGGWYTSQEGQAQDEWLFGKMVGMMGAFSAQANDSMKVEKPMTLYAKWIAPTHIVDAEGLNRMRDDLHGWYVLDCDIDLSGMDDWEQVGEYEVHYEWAEAEWWRNAFKGKLDGQGHTIRNLRLTKPTAEKKAMFGSMADGEICNLILEDCVIDLNTTSTYVAPLVGIMKQGDGQTASITHVQVKNARFEVNLNNSIGAFSGVTALAVGAWGGTVSHCSVQGEMNVTCNGTGGGELYLGGLLGENYCEVSNCQSDFTVNLHFRQPKLDGEFKAFVGGLVASATKLTASEANAVINIDGDPLTEQLFIGGLVGSERYGEISQSSAKMQVHLQGMKKAQVGGILGEFNKGYGSIGAALGTKNTSVHHCHAEMEIQADPAIQLVKDAISGSGTPEPLNAWGGQMVYEVRDNSYK